MATASAAYVMFTNILMVNLLVAMYRWDEITVVKNIVEKFILIFTVGSVSFLWLKIAFRSLVLVYILDLGRFHSIIKAKYAQNNIIFWQEKFIKNHFLHQEQCEYG